MRPRLTGLWRHRDFMRLWTGQTISVFGTMIGGTALPFTAILVLDASPLQVAVLGASRIVPALLFGLVAGVWADRVRRRPLMIAADIGRALIFASIPLAWAFDALTIAHLYVAAFAAGGLTIFFDVAYRSYLPVLVEKEQLLEANSKLSASSSVAEFSGFSTAGWLVQLFSGPLAILVDAVTFIGSAASIGAIRAPEPPPAVPEERTSMRREAVEGMRIVVRDPVLRAIGGAIALHSLGFGLTGATYMLFVTRGLGFEPGVLGVIFGIGGISSLGGALIAQRSAGAAGIGPSMIGGVLLMGGSMLLIPIAPDAALLGALCLIGQQVFGDGAFTVYEINAVSLRQSITPERALGRVNAFMTILELGLTLAGTLIGGWIGETVSLRAALVAGACAMMAAAAWMFLSPIRAVRSAPATIIDAAAEGARRPADA